MMKMEFFCIFFVVILSSGIYSLPLEKTENDVEIQREAHNIIKRFINPLFSLGTAENNELVKMRAKRSEDECEKLQLCKLHARANRNFLSAFELYFVNKENARLWDHQAHSYSDCEERFGDCYDD